MRSLIIIEVEHGEDTDGLQGMYEHLISDTDWYGNGSLMIVNHTVKVDLPSCFVLEGGQPKTVNYAEGFTDTQLAQELIDMDAFDAWLEDTSTLAEFYNKVMTEAANV